jgi:hypothetical protein
MEIAMKTPAYRSPFMLMATLALGMSANAPVAFSAAEVAPKSSFLVHFEKDRLSIEAKNAVGAQLINELSRKTGIVFHIRIAMDESLTLSFRDLPLDRALQHLFGPDANFMFIHRSPLRRRAGTELPIEVWVFGQGGTGAHRIIAPKEDEPVLDETGAALQKTINEFERNPQAANDAARRHSDPTVREAAIRYLGRRKTDDGIAILLDILRETDPHMRQTAFEALGASVENDPRVRQFMNELVHTANDPGVKQFVADALGGTAPTDNGDF